LFWKHLTVLWIVHDFWHNTTTNEEYRFLIVATKINQDGVECKRAIQLKSNGYGISQIPTVHTFKTLWLRSRKRLLVSVNFVKVSVCFCCKVAISSDKIWKYTGTYKHDHDPQLSIEMYHQLMPFKTVELFKILKCGII
jgi:hypothetical protein